MTDRHFPLFIPAEGKKILIFGGGSIALRRIKTLLNYSFELYAVSRSFCEEICILEKENRIKTHREELALNPAYDAIISLKRCLESSVKISTPRCSDYDSCDFYSSVEKPSFENGIETLSSVFGFDLNSEIFLVLSCLDDRELNKKIGEYFRSRGVLVNVCDKREECDFFFPAVAVSDSISAGVTGTGSNHSEVRQAAARIREIVEKKEY